MLLCSLGPYHLLLGGSTQQQSLDLERDVEAKAPMPTCMRFVAASLSCSTFCKLGFQHSPEDLEEIRDTLKCTAE